MKPSHKLQVLVGTTSIIFLLTIGACNSTETDGALKGEIDVDGSSTVFPISEAVAEEFRKPNPRVQVNVGVSGTGGGFKRFTNGETDISNASRTIKPSEVEQATNNDIEFIEMRVGTDGLSVVVHPDNDFVSCLTMKELRQIWEPGSKVKNWNQVRTGLPNKPIHLYGPDPDSGTFDYFTEEVMGELQLSRSDYTMSANDNTLVLGISQDPNALGYFGYAYYTENASILKLISVDSGSGCVSPSPATIANETYTPLSRPLFIYVKQSSLDRPEVKEFIKFYMENGAELARQVGYIPEAATVYTNNLALAGLP